MESLTPGIFARHMEEQSTRRGFLGAAAGLGAAFLLPHLNARAANLRGAERPKSLILLWLAGGPSQLETWDPHPGTKAGGPTRAIETSIPNLQIAELYPQTARCIHELSVIRSLVSKEGDHERGTYLLKTGYRPDPTLVHPSLGAILTHELPDPAVEIPLHVSLVPDQWPARGGFLGDALDAFKVHDPRRGLENVKPHVDEARQKRRVEGLEVVEAAFRRERRRQVDATLHQETIRRALKLMHTPQLAAFQVEQEPQSLRDAYGEHPFGLGCLLARRLVETGVRAVEVTLPGFDSHANNFTAHENNARILDPALAALVADLKQRDLLQSTVVLCLGEFGRTPNINPLDGRDHWPTGFSCLVGGGGLRAGVVIGATDPEGRQSQPEDPMEVHDLFATILDVMGVEYGKELRTPIGRPMALCRGAPIERLLP
jgi:hypothetical protein